MCSSTRWYPISRTMARILLLTWLMFVVLLSGTCLAQEQAGSGKLSLSVAVVDELVAKPVPLTDFRLTRQSGDPFDQTARTDEQGTLVIELRPGEYRIESVRPTRFRGRSLSWAKSFKVEAGQTLALKLTDGDATEAAAGRISEEGMIYQKIKKGIVTVECDLGSGSGFVVDKQGLILTNSHVTNGTNWSAVRFDKGIRVPAVVVEEDTVADIAVLRFNPDAYKEFLVTTLADPSKGPVTIEGEKVLAIGSPISEEKILTIGIISKVDGDVLMSDVNINPGNSGGPLLNLNAEVIGLTTFGVSAGRGPGISGIVAIQKALPALDRARKKLAEIRMPSAELLPDVSPIPIPAEGLQQAAQTEKKSYATKSPKNLDCRILTPFIAASQEAAQEREIAKGRESRTKKRGDKGVKEGYIVAQRKFWERSDAVVTILVRPVLKETSASKTAGFFGAVLGGLSGVYVPTKQEMKFGDDFYDMQLYRGDRLVEPVRRNRSTADILYDNPMIKVVDSAYGGVYAYDPSVFEPGQDLVLKIRRESDLQKWDMERIDPKTQQKIWDEFTLWREVAGKTQGGNQSSGSDRP
jgi:hypothetical protein